MKKIIAILAVFFCLGLLGPFAKSAGLADIGSHPNKVAIQYLYDNNIVAGYADGAFRPNNTLNRAELLKILVGGTNTKPTLEQGYKNCFPDVREEWFAPYVCYAKAKGWVSGYPDGSFQPARTVNKVEAIKMLIHSQSYSVPSQISSPPFDDVDIKQWYAPYIAVAKEKGLLNETGNHYGVSDGMMRGTISENIYRALIILLNNKSLAPGDHKFSITHDGIERYYLLHIPQNRISGATPLVMAFHGGLGSAENLRDSYDLAEKSDEEGFIVAFPNGVSRSSKFNLGTWNAGTCCGYADESQSDDVGFVKAVLADIEKKVRIGDIYATGMSNGGMLSHRLACDMADTFSAIAAVAGTMNYDDCEPSKPISVMHIHSLVDDHVLFEGGCGPDCIAGGETEHTSVPETMSRWVEHNQCETTPERVFENDGAYCDLYSSCSEGVQMKLCVTDDGGHSWPGLSKPNEGNQLEQNMPSQKLSATDQMWDFFMANKH